MFTHFSASFNKKKWPVIFKSVNLVETENYWATFKTFARRRPSLDTIRYTKLLGVLHQQSFWYCQTSSLFSVLYLCHRLSSEFWNFGGVEKPFHIESLWFLPSHFVSESYYDSLSMLLTSLRRIQLLNKCLNPQRLVYSASLRGDFLSGTPSEAKK